MWNAVLEHILGVVAGNVGILLSVDHHHGEDLLKHRSVPHGDAELAGLLLLLLASLAFDLASHPESERVVLEGVLALEKRLRYSHLSPDDVPVLTELEFLRRIGRLLLSEVSHLADFLNLAACADGGVGVLFAIFKLPFADRTSHLGSSSLDWSGLSQIRLAPLSSPSP